MSSRYKYHRILVSRMYYISRITNSQENRCMCGGVVMILTEIFNKERKRKKMSKKIPQMCLLLLTNGLKN